MIESLHRLKGWLAKVVLANDVQGPSPTGTGLPRSTKANPLTAVRQAVQGALPVVEEQFAALRTMEELLLAVEDCVGQAWHEREALIDDYYQILRGLLRVLDDCRIVTEENAELDVVCSGLGKLLDEQQVEQIEVHDGDSFQPERHDCEQTEESEQYAPGTVLRVVETGYQRRLANGNTVVVRPARVVVSEQKRTKSKESGT